MPKSPKKPVHAKKQGDQATKWIAAGMVVFVLIIAVAFAFMNSQSNKKLVIPTSVSKSEGYGIVVNPTAKVKVDFWEDFQCPNCRNFEAVANAYFDDLVKAGKIKAVYHSMSFIGPESVIAAQAGACAADQGKFVQMHTMLYANQPAHENSGQWTNDAMLNLAKAAGVNTSTFKSCLSSGKYQNWTGKVADDASKRGVNSTPTLFINGKELDRTHYLDLALLKKDLAAAGVK